MIHPEKLRVEAWAQFKRADLRLDHRGATFLRGRNDDAGGSPHGAGKSSLVNAMYAMLFGEHQLAVKKRSLRDHVRDQTRICATMRVDDLRVLADLRGSDLKVRVDGQDVESRKKGDDRTELLRLVGVSPELWASTVHVNGIAGNPLLRGTSSARCQFLERAFDLDRWAALYVKTGDVVSQMKRADQELEVARGELEALGPVADVEADRELVERLARRRDRLAADLKRATRDAATAAALPERPQMSVRELDERVRTLTGEVERVGAVAVAHAEWNDRHARHVEARRVLLAARKLLESLPRHRDGDDGDLAARLSECQREHDELKRAVREWPAVRAWRDAATEMARSHGIEFRGLDQLRALSQNWVSNLEGGQRGCPVCGGPLKRAVDAARLREIGELLGSLPERVASPGRQARERLETLRDHEGALRTRLREAEALAGARRELEGAEALTEKSRPGERPRGDPERARTAPAELAAAREQLRAARAWVDAPRGSPRELERVRDDLAARLDETRRRLDEARARNERADAGRGERERLTKRVSDLEREVALRPAYQALRQAYSPNGLRLWVLQELLEAITAGMNEGMHPSRDRQQYGYRLSRNRELTLTASNATATYDVRTLSGAEGSFYVLNFLSVVLPMLPSRRRCSLLILDEVDANCSAHARQVMSSEYIPRLTKMADVLVVTPSPASEFGTRGARELIAVKRGGVSRLEGE